MRLTPLRLKHYTTYPNFIMHYMSRSVLHSSPFAHTHTHTHTHTIPQPLASLVSLPVPPSSPPPPPTHTHTQTFPNNQQSVSEDSRKSTGTAANACERVRVAQSRQRKVLRAAQKLGIENCSVGYEQEGSSRQGKPKPRTTGNQSP